ncbi:hemerythrin domain-containing protein [Streptomyces sp. NPDC098781]|uniref:hemerythrin domain-containing protein n=1 Tax=Streptomyces sp. NPDC098781 TaxID=3366097 RepID=UPI003816C299
MPRIDLYRNVHMGQRARLFTLAVELGAADISRNGAAAEQADRCLAMTRELREHADHEDTYIHQLLRERSPQAADALEAEHVRLDAAFAALDDRARDLPGTPADALPEAQHALYLALGEVISAYLAHLHLEETVAMPALWQYADEKELSALLAAFRASRTPEETLTDLHRMLPALPPTPRAAIVRDVLDNTPGPAERTLASVSATLSPEQRNRLGHDLGMAEV